MERMGIYNEVVSSKTCPNNRLVYIIEDDIYGSFEERVNDEIKGLGSRFSSSKIHVLPSKYVCILWYYPKKSKEEKEACITKCGICGTIEGNRLGSWVKTEWFCYECLSERLSQ